MFTFYGMQPLVGLVQVIPDMGTVLESDLTPFPREDGAAAVSHRVLKPIRLTMEVRLGLENDISQVRAVWSRLRQLWQDGTIMEVVTLKDSYPNMAIKRVAEITRGEYWNGLSARVQLQEAQVVTVAAPTVPTSGLGAFSREALATDSIQPAIPPEYFETPTQIAMIAQERAEGDSRVTTARTHLIADARAEVRARVGAKAGCRVHLLRRAHQDGTAIRRFVQSAMDDELGGQRHPPIHAPARSSRHAVAG